MFKLTKEMALKMQELHIRYYADRFPGGERALRATLAALTNADRLKPGIFYAPNLINTHIPRAHAIDALICRMAE